MSEISPDRLCRNCQYSLSMRRPLPKDCPWCAQYRPQQPAQCTLLPPFEPIRHSSTKHTPVLSDNMSSANTNLSITPSEQSCFQIAQQNINSASGSQFRESQSTFDTPTTASESKPALTGSLMTALYQDFQSLLCQNCQQWYATGFLTQPVCRNCEIIRVLRTRNYAKAVVDNAYQWHFEGTDFLCLTTPSMLGQSVARNERTHSNMSAFGDYKSISELVKDSQPDLSTACTCPDTSSDGLGWAVVAPPSYPRKTKHNWCTGACDNSLRVLQCLFQMPDPWWGSLDRATTAPKPGSVSESNEVEERRRRTW